MGQIKKAKLVTVLTHQAATHPTTIVGDPIDCTLASRAIIYLYHGYVEATADTNGHIKALASLHEGESN